MLADVSAQPTVAVKDLDKAKAFYGGALGLEPVVPPMGGVQCYLAGRSVIVVYQSQLAGTNQATAITWPLGDQLDATVATLKARGVAFEHYDMPGMRREGDIHLAGDLRLAWFKDPDGNIIHLGSFGSSPSSR